MKTAWLNPGTVVSDSSVGTVAWTNIGNVASSNNVYATAALNAGQATRYIKATNFGASVPVGAIITGVEVAVEGKAAGGMAVGRVTNTRLVVGGTIVGDVWPEAGLLATDQRGVLGLASYKWGLSLTQSQVVAANFGVVVGADAFGSDSTTISIDHVQLRIHYVMSRPLSMSQRAGLLLLY